MGLDSHYAILTTMAGLMRTGLKAATLARQCSRLAVTQQRNYSEMAFTFASPTDVYYNAASVKQVDVPSFSGSFGILPNHVPSLAILKPGVVTVFEDDGSNKKFFVSSGPIAINEDSSVQVLADVNAASSERAKAEAQIALECYEALAKALEN